MSREVWNIIRKIHPVKYAVLGIIEGILAVCFLAAALLPGREVVLPVGQALTSEAVHLNPGVYRICLSYQVSENGKDTMTASCSAPQGCFLSDTVNLYTGETQTDATVWLFAPVDDFTLTVSCGSGDITVGDALLQDTRALWRMLLFLTVLISLLADTVAVLRDVDTEKGIPLKDKQTALALSGITLLASIPLFVDYQLVQGDVLFHLSRIEGIARALSNGIFPVRIQPGWVGGQGYAVSIFYGDTLLYIPALLRLMGFR